MTSYRDYLGRASAALDAEAERSPELFHALLNLATVPDRRGALSPRDAALIGIAVAGNPTSMNADRLRVQVSAAIAAGATRDQILDTLQMASVLGVHSLTVGIAELANALTLLGDDPMLRPLTAEQLQHRARFEARRGYWHESWDEMLALDPDMFGAYLEYSSLPAENGAIDAGLRELIYIAIDAVSTHMYAPGLQLHAVNALNLGMTTDQIISALEIASTMMPTAYLTAVETISDLLPEAEATR